MIKKRVGLVTAMKIERPGSIPGVKKEENVYVLDHAVVLAAVCGVGQQKASKATDRLCREFKPDVIVLCGFCGATYAGACAGDLVVVEGVHYNGNCERISGNEMARIKQILQKLTLSGESGGMQTFDTFVTSREKVLPGIKGVDMEAYAVVKKSKEYQVDVCVAKVVSDIIPGKSRFLLPGVRQFFSLCMNLPAAKKSLGLFYSEYFKSFTSPGMSV